MTSSGKVFAGVFAGLFFACCLAAAASAAVPAVTNLHSPSHPDPDRWYASRRAVLAWTPLAGIAGYSSLLDHDPSSAPGTGVDVGTWGFSDKVDYHTGALPQDVAAGDLDADGVPDLVVCNYQDDTIGVLFGRGDGTYATQVTYPTGSGPSGVAIGDLDGDATPDLVVAERWTGSVGVLLNTGTGTFSAATEYPLSIPAFLSFVAPTSVALCDFDGDGRLDLAAVKRWGDAVEGGALSVLPGNGDGTFGPRTDYDLGLGIEYDTQVIASDFNDDGAADLAVADDWGLQVFLGDGHGAFGAGAEYASGWVCSSVCAADLDGDGLPDLAVVDMASAARVGVLLNTGGGVFAAPVSYATGDYPQAVAAADFDGDGNPDLAATSWKPQIANEATDDTNVRVYLGDGHGAFGQPMDFTTAPGPCALVPADLDENGKVDLVTANANDHSLSVLLNAPDVASARVIFDDIGPHATGGYPGLIGIADFDGDGALDLAEVDGDVANVLTGDGAGGLTAQADYSLGTYSWLATIADVDGDGRPDLAGVDSETGDLRLLLNEGGTGFRLLTQPAADRFPDAVAAGDVDRDGHADLVVANWTTQAIRVLLGNGDGTFRTGTDYAVPAYVTRLALADFDGDGWSDVAGAIGDGGAVLVLRNDGAGRFGAAVSHRTEGFPDSMAVADLDGDGDLDLAVANDLKVGTVTVLLGDGEGGFAPGTSYGAGQYPVSLVSADCDGDGWPDLVVGNHDSGAVSVLRNSGSGTFVSRTAVPSFADPWSLVAGDLTGDGRPDLVVGSYAQQGAVTVLRNASVASSTGQTLSVPTDGVWYYHLRAVDGLGNGGDTAVRELRVDTRRPTLRAAVCARAVHGRVATLRFKVIDPRPGSPTASVVITIRNAAGRAVKTLHLPRRAVNTALRARFRCTLVPGRYRFSVSATDAAGNRQTRAAGNTLLVR